MLEGYCGEFVTLAASLAQTLEQAAMRQASLERNRESLMRVERGMRDLADAIGALLTRDRHATPPAAPAARDRAAPPGPAVTPQAATTGEAPRSAPKPAGNCIIEGSTESLPLASVFQFLSRTHKTGLLRVEAAGETLTFHFAEGRVESSTTDRPQRRDRLGDVLVELGFVGWAEIEPLARSGRPLGEELVRAGLLTNERLGEALRLQMQRRFDRIAAAKPARYSFHEDPSRESGRVSVRAADLRLASRRPIAQPR